MLWRSIDEPVERLPVILRGVLVTGPEAYARPGRRLGIAALASWLTTVAAWCASLLAHIAPLALLMGLVVVAGPSEDGLVSVGLSVREAAPPGPPAGKAPEKPKQPDPPAPPPPVPEPKEEPPGKPIEPPPEPKAPAPPADEKPPAAIGTGGTEGGAPPKGVDAKQVEADPGEAVKAARSKDLERLRRGKKSGIVVVAGVYDKTEEVLAHLGVPHTVIEPKDITEHSLAGCGVLIIDCNNTYAQNGGVDQETIDEIRKDVARLEARVEQLQAQIIGGEKRGDTRVKKWRDDLRKATADLAFKRRLVGNLVDIGAVAKKIRGFVAGGGTLFTSDWGLTLVEKAFKGSVKVGGYVGPKNVRIQPRPEMEAHPLLKEVFVEPAKGGTTTKRTLRWQIDGSSYQIKVESALVDVLVESPEISNPRAVVVAFRHDGETCVTGRGSKAGRVVHMLSHFADQADRFGDYALQNMLVNILVERFP